MLIVTTPTDPVSGAAANSPPIRLRSSRLSRRRRQHIERASSGFMSLLMKLAKYGMPYLAVICHIGSSSALSQSKSFPKLYVGMGNVNTRPLASPSYITSAKARLSKFISCWKSPYVLSCCSPPMMTGSSRSMGWGVRSSVMLVNGV